MGGVADWGSQSATPLPTLNCVSPRLFNFKHIIYDSGHDYHPLPMVIFFFLFFATGQLGLVFL